MPTITAAEWDDFLSHHTHAHLLQTSLWGNLKAAFGWEVLYVLDPQGEAGAQVLFRRIPFGFRIAYIAKGPVGGDLACWARLWPEIDQASRKHGAIFLKVEPDLWEDSLLAGVLPPGFRCSPITVQPPRTLLLDLKGDEERLLARMKQKTRYNIRLALKKGVVVRPSADLELFSRMMQVTGTRDGFGVHSLQYYRRAYELFHPRGQCELLVAEYEREPLAALMVFAAGARAWYLYGASTDAHREMMPAYLLQWEAMRWARSRGCTQYDLWGVPDADEASLEAGFGSRGDGLWGVYRFKRGFGGELHRAAGPWDRVYVPLLYQAYLLAARKRAGVGV